MEEKVEPSRSAANGPAVAAPSSAELAATKETRSEPSPHEVTMGTTKGFDSKIAADAPEASKRSEGDGAVVDDARDPSPHKRQKLSGTMASSSSAGIRSISSGSGSAPRSVAASASNTADAPTPRPPPPPVVTSDTSAAPVPAGEDGSAMNEQASNAMDGEPSPAAGSFSVYENTTDRTSQDAAKPVKRLWTECR